MIERRQPVVTGVNENGELLWGIIPMPRWQMEMFRVKYYGDFMAFWMRITDAQKVGRESDAPSMELTARKGLKKKSWPRWGD